MQLLDFTFPFPVRNPFRPSSSSSLHYLLKAVFMAFPFDSVPKLKTLFQDFIFLFLVFPLCFAVAHPKVPRFSSWVGKIRWRRDRVPTPVFSGFPCGSAGKESACNAGDQGSIPGWGRSPGEGKGYPLQYSGLENSSPWGLKELDMTEWLSLSLHFKQVEGPGEVWKADFLPWSPGDKTWLRKTVELSVATQLPVIL